jgi:hypothetical protein
VIKNLNKIPLFLVEYPKNNLSFQVVINLYFNNQVMKIIKKIASIILGLIALLLIIALFVNKEYAVVREVKINKPKSEVFGYVKYLKNQDNYSVWAKMDPLMKKEYKGTDGTVGFVSAWDSNVKDVGKGEQEITKITDGERLDVELRFFKPFKSTDYAYMITENISNNETKVLWGFKGKMPYPMNLMLLCMNMDKMLGKDLETGLQNLKSTLEK